MAYDVDYDYPFDHGEGDVTLLPRGVTEDGELYVLPNGKYLPPGVYRMSDGCDLIYEPHALSPFSDMLAQFREGGD